MWAAHTLPGVCVRRRKPVFYSTPSCNIFQAKKDQGQESGHDQEGLKYLVVNCADRSPNKI